MIMDIKNVGIATLAAITAVILTLTYFSTDFTQHSALKTSAIVSAEKCVIIDAGHGGFDGGAVADDGTLEKDINLQIALATADILEAMGFDVVLTRKNDAGLESPEDKTIRRKKITDMNARLDIIQSNESAVFVSVHLNKYTTSSPKGTQVFYSPNREESAVLAQCIQESVKNMLQRENQRQIKKSGSDTMLLHKATIPAVIVECGFLSNPEELQLLKNSEYQRKMAVCIVSGIINYMESENNGG